MYPSTICIDCQGEMRKESLDAQRALAVAADAQPPLIISSSSLGEQLAAAASKAIAFIDSCITRGHQVLLADDDPRGRHAGNRAAQRMIGIAKELSIVAVKYQAQVDLGKLRATGDGSAIREVLARIDQIQAADAGESRSPDESSASHRNSFPSTIPPPLEE